MPNKNENLKPLTEEEAERIEANINAYMQALYPVAIKLATTDNGVNTLLMACGLGKLLGLVISYATQENPQDRPECLDAVLGLIRQQVMDTDKNE